MTLAYLIKPTTCRPSKWSNTSVATTSPFGPGSEFGAAGERHLRLFFAADREAITIASNGLRGPLTNLPTEAHR
jgi:bifunctional pyridoxal-dependent enzyme with beta-cystathionase and maltose regulon repressor activities